MISASTVTSTSQELAPCSAPPGLRSWGRASRKPIRIRALTGQLQEASPFSSQGGSGLRLHPPLFLLAPTVAAQQPRAQSTVTVGLVGTRTPTGTQARLPTAGEACSLPWRPGRGRAEVGNWVCRPSSTGGMQARLPCQCSKLQAPLLEESPKLQSRPSPTRGNENGWSLRAGSAENHPELVLVLPPLPQDWRVQTPSPTTPHLR